MEQHNEKNQQPGRVVKRRRVRYDRILIALAIVVLIFILFFSCTCSCVKCVCSPSDNADNTKISATEATSEGSTTSNGSTPAETDKNANNGTSTDSAAQSAASLTAKSDDVHRGSLVVVNADNPYTFLSGDTNLVSVEEKRSSSYTADNADVLLDETAVSRLNQFISEFVTVTGKNDVKIESAYRSKEDQDSKYANGSSIFAGGYSDYHTGRSFDICIEPDGMKSYYVPSGDYEWINKNAHKYGFILRYPEGKFDATGVNPRSYTFRYVGLPHSYYMYENDLCLEEYVEKLKSYNSASPLTIDTGDAVWTVFYTELSADGVSAINIPSCQEYSISGDNIGGFIVAYH